VNAKDLGCYDFGKGELEAWDDGHWQAIADTYAAAKRVSEAAIVVGNHAVPTHEMRLTNGSTWNAKMFEHFIPVHGSPAAYVPTGSQMSAYIEDGSYPGGLINEMHVDFCVSAISGKREGNSMYARSLAAFLIGASNYSYYGCTNGWGFTDGWSRWSTDYDRPLGVPTGKAVKTNAGVWTRAFASGTKVFLATKDQSTKEWGSSCIRWSDGHVTKSGRLCESLREEEREEAREEEEERGLTGFEEGGSVWGLPGATVLHPMANVPTREAREPASAL
jgi:hypothetical protein